MHNDNNNKYNNNNITNTYNSEQKKYETNIKNSNLQYLFEHLNRSSSNSKNFNTNKYSITNRNFANNNNTNSPNANATNNHHHHINQLFYLKNKLYNLNEQNSKQILAHTNRFEDLYDKNYCTSLNNNINSNRPVNSEPENNKRRSAHLFNL
jgi:hypothetical protein